MKANIIFFFLLCLTASETQAFFTDVQTLSTQIKTGDWMRPPVELLVSTNGEEKKVAELINNGSFIKGFAGWEVIGDVNIAHNKATIESGESLSQILTTEQNAFIGFWLTVGTEEYVSDFDSPLFVVSLGQDVIYQLSAQDIINFPNSQTEHSFVMLPLAAVSQEKLTFAVHDTGDTKYNSWARITGVTTLVQVSSHQTYFKLTSDEAATVCYQIGEQPTCASQQLEFSLDQPDVNFTYWATDTAQNKSPIKNFFLRNDSDLPPAVTDLQVYAETGGQVSLTFTIPELFIHQLPIYAQLRFSERPIVSESDWNSAQVAFAWPHHRLIASFSQFNLWTAVDTQKEDLVLRDIPTGEKFFALKLVDSAKNTSLISNSPSAVVE